MRSVDESAALAGAKPQMHGWLLFERDLDPALPEVPEVLRFCETAAARGMTLEVMRPHSFDIVVGQSASWDVQYAGKPVDRPDFILCRTGAETDYFTLALLRHFERRGVRLINGSVAIEMVADKLHTMQRLSRAGLPVPGTILSKFPANSDLVERELGFPVIVKTLRGTRGAGVLKCDHREQFDDLTALLASAQANAEFILQHYVRASHGRDVRLLVVGGRVVAAMERRSLTGGFKSNVSLGGVGEAVTPPNEMVELAVKCADVLGLDVTGVDILYDEDGYRICEANSAPGFQGLERATGLDIPTIILDWIEASHASASPSPTTPANDILVDFVFGGQAGLRTFADARPDFRSFAFASSWRLVTAGLRGMALATTPLILRDRRSATNLALRGLYDNRLPGIMPGRAQADQDSAFLVVVAASIWAALIPWLAGADATFAGILTLLALMFPVASLLTQPTRRADKAEGRR